MHQLPIPASAHSAERKSNEDSVIVADESVNMNICPIHFPTSYENQLDLLVELVVIVFATSGAPVPHHIMSVFVTLELIGLIVEGVPEARRETTAKARGCRALPFDRTGRRRFPLEGTEETRGRGRH